MNSDEYIQIRVDGQINWYDKHSLKNQKWYRILKILAIVSASIIPLLVGFIAEDTIYLRLTVGGLGVIVAIATSIQSIFKLQENWIKYRTTCESLKHIKYLYITNIEPYNIDDKFELLVKNIESIISKENVNWSQYVKTREKTN